METNLALIEKELIKETDPVVNGALVLNVSTVAEKEIAVSEMNLVNGLIKKVKETFGPIKEKAHAAHKEVCDQEKRHLLPLETAILTIKQKIGTFDLEMKRLREEEERKAREEAQRAYEEQLAEAQKMIDEILAKTQDVDETVELLNMELKRDDLNEIERQKLESQLDIAIATKDNNLEKVEEIHARASEPVFVPPTPRLVVPDTKTKGASTRFELVPQVVNKMALIKAVANGTVPDTVLDVNMGQLKRFVNMMKRPVPGVSCEEKAVVSGRAS
ncbi:MAG: hypothetical protein WC261_12040 [Synergistaceae bacterium]|jgi:hypothetical protein